jgi:hypothetical protein
VGGAFVEGALGLILAHGRAGSLVLNKTKTKLKQREAAILCPAANPLLDENQHEISGLGRKTCLSSY